MLGGVAQENMDRLKKLITDMISSGYAIAFGDTPCILQALGNSRKAKTIAIGAQISLIAIEKSELKNIGLDPDPRITIATVKLVNTRKGLCRSEGYKLKASPQDREYSELLDTLARIALSASLGYI